MCVLIQFSQREGDLARLKSQSWELGGTKKHAGLGACAFMVIISPLYLRCIANNAGTWYPWCLNSRLTRSFIARSSHFSINFQCSVSRENWSLFGHLNLLKFLFPFPESHTHTHPHTQLSYVSHALVHTHTYSQLNLWLAWAGSVSRHINDHKSASAWEHAVFLFTPSYMRFTRSWLPTGPVSYNA